MFKTVLYGIPGSGKTTHLIGLLKQHGDLSKCLVISYSRRAALEIRERIGICKGDEETVDRYALENFRTVHSECSRLLGFNKEDFIKDSHILEWMNFNKIEYDDSDAVEYSETKDGFKFLAMIDGIRAIKKMRFDEYESKALEKEIGEFISANGRFKRLPNDVHFLEELVRNYEAYKQNLQKYDYTDILLHYLRNPVPAGCAVLAVDEFQDVSPLIYEIVKLFEREADFVYYAGDPWQAIYTFMGASPEFLLQEMKLADKVIVLNQSHRVPENILLFAKSVINNNCIAKLGEMRGTENGLIKRINYQWIPALVLENKETWYILARTNFIIDTKILPDLKKNGIEYDDLRSRRNDKWTKKLININNAVIAVSKRMPLKSSWLVGLIKALPASPCLVRGIKQNIEKMTEGREIFSVDELRGMMFDVKYPPEMLPNDLDRIKLTARQKTMLKAKMARNPSMIDTLRIQIGTIHSAKGAEAMNVVIDLTMSTRIKVQLVERRAREAESRIFYTGLTRVKKSLYVIGSNNLVVM